MPRGASTPSGKALFNTKENANGADMLFYLGRPRGLMATFRAGDWRHFDVRLRGRLGCERISILPAYASENAGSAQKCQLSCCEQQIDRAMRYTPSQVRHVVGITQETLRHWRRALPSLDGLKGHAPVFRPGQLLGLAVVRVLVEDLGLTVGALRAAERDIFDICSSPQWIRLAQGHLLVRPIQGQVAFVEAVSDSDLDRPAILLPFEPIVTALRLALLEVAPEETQQSIAFPPVDVSERRAAGSARS